MEGGCQTEIISRLIGARLSGTSSLMLIMAPGYFSKLRSKPLQNNQGEQGEPDATQARQEDDEQQCHHHVESILRKLDDPERNIDVHGPQSPLSALFGYKG
jgi:hypothetical protein